MSQFGMMNVMVSLMPEEELVEKAIEALNNYKLGIGEKDKKGNLKKPMQEISILTLKFQQEGMSSSQILAKAEKIEAEVKIMKAFMPGEDKTTLN